MTLIFILKSFFFFGLHHFGVFRYLASFIFLSMTVLDYHFLLLFFAGNFFFNIQIRINHHMHVTCLYLSVLYRHFIGLVF